MVIDIFDPEYIAKVGFPIVAFAAAFGIVATITTLIIKSQIKRQEKLDSQYFANIYNALDKYDKSLKEMRCELTKIAIEMGIVSTKIDTYINKLDQHFDAKNVTYVFREGKIYKIKNMIEEIDVTRNTD